MKKFSQDTRTKIAWEIRKWLSLEQIQENHPQLEIFREDVLDIKKRSIICKYLETDEWLKRYCNNCWVPRLFTNEFFRKDPTGKNWLSSKCKICAKVIWKNKHIIKSRTDPDYKKKRCQYEKDWKKNNPEWHNKREEKRKEKYHNDPEYNKIRKAQNVKSKRKSRAKAKSLKKTLQTEKN